jgi:hypothetical protein
MRAFKNILKTTFNTLLGNYARLESPSNIFDVVKLIDRLKPVAISKPLIRLGSECDGGYLVPDDLEGISAAISPGVSTEIGFDITAAEYGIEVYMADASVSGPPIQNPRFHFHKKFVDVFDDENNIRLDSLFASINPKHSGDLILQMDIEGAEYKVLLDASDDALKGFRIMVIEFHHLDRMFTDFSFNIINATFQKLLRFHHVVHIHPNNVCRSIVRGDVEIPPVMEFTFYRKDRAVLAKNKNQNQEQDFPHFLDRDNLSHMPTVVLPKCWR